MKMANENAIIAVVVCLSIFLSYKRKLRASRERRRLQSARRVRMVTFAFEIQRRAAIRLAIFIVVGEEFIFVFMSTEG